MYACCFDPEDIRPQLHVKDALGRGYLSDIAIAIRIYNLFIDCKNLDRTGIDKTCPNIIHYPK